jgi:hypothetical protein
VPTRGSDSKLAATTCAKDVHRPAERDGYARAPERVDDSKEAASTRARGAQVPTGRSEEARALMKEDGAVSR